jgi:hypothetical protein
MRPEYELVVGSAAPYLPRKVALNARELFGAK